MNLELLSGRWILIFTVFYFGHYIHWIHGAYSFDASNENGYRLPSRFKYLLVSPKTVRPDQSYQVFLTVYEEPINSVQVKVSLSRNGEEYASGEDMVFHKGTKQIQIKIPDIVLDGQHILQVEGTIKDQTVFSNKTELRYHSKHVSLFIMTDKPVYYPHDPEDSNQQEVYFKIIGTTPGLKAMDGPMTIYVKDGNGLTVRRWIQKQLNFGFYQDSFPLPYPVNIGKWSIVVDAFGHIYRQYFLVKFWYLRRFDVIVDTPLKIFTSEWGLAGTVFAEHTSNKEVTGNGTVMLRVRNEDGEFMEGNLTFPLHHVYGLTSFKFSMQDIKSSFGEDLNGKEFFVKAWVYDYFWLDRHDGTAVTKIYQEGGRIKILGKKIRSFKPGVPFTVIFIVQNSDGSPYLSFLNRQITVQRIHEGDPSSTVPEEKLLIPDDSIVRYTVIPAIGDRIITIRAWHDLTQQTEEIECYRFWTENNKFFAVTTSTKEPTVDSYAIFTVRTNFYVEEINYIVMAQGNILAGNTLTMNNKQTTFSLAMSRDMAPASRLLVYCLEDGEILNDAINFYINDSMLYKADLNLNAGKNFKGDYMELLISGPRAGFVSVHGHHREMYLRGGGTFLNDQKITRDLLEYNHGDDVDGPHHHIWSYNDERWDGNVFFNNPTTGIDHWTTFNVSGLVVLSDTNLTVKPETTHCNRTLGFGRCLSGECFDLIGLCDGIVDCTQDGYDEMACPNQPVAVERPHELDDLHLIRKHFVETYWIWKTSYIKPYGNAEIMVEVPNINVEYMIGAVVMHPADGLAVVNTPLRYNLARKFWMSVEAPPIIQRGEQIGIRCTVFNEWDQDIEAVMTFHGGDEYRFVVVEEFGIVSSYAPRTIAGDIQIMISLERKKSMYVHFPMVSLLGSGSFEVTISAHSILRTDTQTIGFDIWVRYDGYQDDNTLPYIIDLVNQGSVIVPDFDISVPEQFYVPGQRELLYVPGSPLAYVYLWGNVALPEFFDVWNAENTQIVPYDSADGYLYDFAIHLLNLEYLKTTNGINTKEEFRVVELLRTFYIRLWAYMREDGAFRMFRRTESPCLWLTSAVLRYIHDAHTTEWDEYIGIDVKELNKMALWITTQFNYETGRFEEPSEVDYDRNMGSWTNDTDGVPQQWYIATNAHVVITLSTANRLTGVARSQAEQTKQAAAEYLASKMNYISDPYNMAILAYALHLAGHRNRDDAYWRLKSMKRESEYVYWAAIEVEPNPNKIVDNRVIYGVRDMIINQGNAVLATSYALLLYLDHNEIAASVPIMKWIQTQRSTVLAFSGTRDALIANKALMQFAYRETNRDFYNMEVTIEATKPEDPMWRHVVRLNSSNFAQFHEFELTEAWGEFLISAKGTGYAVIVMTEMYNLEHDHQVGQPGYEPYPFMIECRESYPHGRNASIFNQTFCLKWVRPDHAPAAGMTALNIGLPTGFVLSRDVIERMHQDNNIPGLKRIRARDGFIKMLFDHVSTEEMCFDLQVERWYPVANVSTGHMVQLREYTEQGVQTNTIWYTYQLFHQHICQVCGSFQCPYCPFYNNTYFISPNLWILLIILLSQLLFIRRLY